MNTERLLNNDGHLTDEAIYLYTDALKLDISDTLPNEVLEHVQECRQCKQAIMEIHDLVRDQDYQNLRPHPYFDQKKTNTKFTHSTITRLAAAIVLGLGLAFLVYIFIPDLDKPVAIDDPIEEPAGISPEEFIPVKPDVTEPEKEIIAPPDTPRPAELFAANFEPSPFYESLTGQSFRSHAIRVQTPEQGEEISNAIHFSWITRTPFAVTVQLLNNTENVIWQTTTEEQSVTFAADLDPGIYYWRLETDEELLYVGKIIVPLP